jgi:D-serine dehydratase
MASIDFDVGHRVGGVAVPGNFVPGYRSTGIGFNTGTSVSAVFARRWHPDRLRATNVRVVAKTLDCHQQRHKVYVAALPTLT